MRYTKLKKLLALFVAVGLLCSVGIAATVGLGTWRDESSAFSQLRDPNDPNSVMVNAGQFESGGMGSGGWIDAPADQYRGSGYAGQSQEFDRYRGMLPEANGGFGLTGFHRGQRHIDWPDAAQPSNHRQGFDGGDNQDGYGQPAACFREGGYDRDMDILQRPAEAGNRRTPPIIPEPVTICLLGLGGGYILRRRARQS